MIWNRPYHTTIEYHSALVMASCMGKKIGNIEQERIDIPVQCDFYCEFDIVPMSRRQQKAKYKFLGVFFNRCHVKYPVGYYIDLLQSKSIIPTVKEYIRSHYTVPVIFQRTGGYGHDHEVSKPRMQEMPRATDH